MKIKSYSVGEKMNQLMKVASRIHEADLKHIKFAAEYNQDLAQWGLNLVVYIIKDDRTTKYQASHTQYENALDEMLENVIAILVERHGQDAFILNSIGRLTRDGKVE